MIYIDVKYILLVSHRLRNFKRTAEYVFNCSCPLCGDSATDPKKARGYFYRYKGPQRDGINYKCHHCGAGLYAENFIKEVDPVLYKEMRLELYQPKRQPKTDNLKPPPPAFDKTKDPLKGLKKIADLPKNHPARQYVANRHIPEFHWDDLYFTPTFFEWTSHVVPGKYKVPKDKRDDEPRLMIPLRNKKGVLTGMQGRYIGTGPVKAKYLHIALTDSEAMVWGLDKINFNKKVYVLEGPIDAMFVPNAIGACGGDLINNALKCGIPRKNLVIVFDNEPRKKETIAKIEKVIDSGLAVCIWPEMEEKDINDMVKSHIRYGLEEACKFIFAKIQAGTCDGIRAKLALSKWKRTPEPIAQK